MKLKPETKAKIWFPPQNLELFRDKIEESFLNEMQYIENEYHNIKKLNNYIEDSIKTAEKEYYVKAGRKDEKIPIYSWKTEENLRLNMAQIFYCYGNSTNVFLRLLRKMFRESFGKQALE